MPSSIHNNCNCQSLSIAVIILSVLLAIIFIAIFAYIYWKYRQRKSDPLNGLEITEFNGKPDQTIQMDLYSFSNLDENNKYKISKDDVIIDETSVLVNQGVFTYKGLLKDGRTVSVKRLEESNLEFRYVVTEIQILKYLGVHPNVLSFIGTDTWDINSKILLVFTEFCECGPLQKYLQSDSFLPSGTKVESSEDVLRFQKSPTFKIMLKFAHEIATGMEYIASKNVVHCDLSSRNILLTARRVAKIASFEMSRRLLDSLEFQLPNYVPLPWREMAIETYESRTFSSKSDVWSFGITLWQIFSRGGTPYSGLSYTQEFKNKLHHGLRPSQPQLASDEIYSVMLKCWNLKPELRPDFTELKEIFGRLFQFHVAEEDVSFTSPASSIGSEHLYENINIKLQ